MTRYPAAFNKVIEVVADIDPVSVTEHLACDWGNAQACADDNELRARFAGIAVKAYAERTGKDEPPETIIDDLLNDLRHLCDALGLDFESIVAHDTAYQAELRGTF